jgi:hypothetical protein
MALKPYYTNESEIPAALRSEYAAEPVEVKLDDKTVKVFPILIDSNFDGWSVENVKGLKSALSRQTEENRKLKESTQTVTAEVETLRAKVAELSAIDPEREADRLAEEKAKARIEALKTQHAKEKGDVEGTVKTLEGEVYTLLVDNTSTRELTEAGVLPRMLPLMLDHVHKVTRVRKNDAGKRVVEVLDDAGNPRIKDGQATPFTLKDLVVELREQIPEAFKGTGKSGSGTQQNNQNSSGGGGKLAPEQVAGMSMSEYRKARAEGRIG